VKINWLLTGTDIQGIASLRGIVLTQSMVDLTAVSPLEWGKLFVINFTDIFKIKVVFRF